MRGRVLVAILGLCSTLIVLSGSPASASLPTTLGATADIAFNSVSSGTNHANAKVLYASAARWRAYLRFPTAQIDDAATITSATIRLYGTRDSASKWQVHPAGAGWSERTTYESRPSWDRTVLGTSAGGATANSWNDIAIPVSAISKVGSTNVALRGTVAGKIGFKTSEAVREPRLILTYGGVDTDPPSTTVTSQPSATVSDRNASFSFTADEPSMFECSLDGAAFAGCRSPKSYADLADGSHSFRVRAIDTAGNFDPTPAVVRWTVDAVERPTASPKPLGVPGPWVLRFADEFEGTRLDTSRWVAHDGWTMNNVTVRSSNVSVADGELRLRLASDLTGAFISSAPYDGAGENGFTLPVGGYTEARVAFAGSASQDIYNWPAWWTSGPNWPAAGEHDIAEGLGGDLTVNYHGTTRSQNFGTPCCGPWSNKFHVFGVHRKASSADVYWDGRLVRSYPTGDDGRRQALLLNMGKSNSRTPVTGLAGALRVDYVRAWTP